MSTILVSQLLGAILQYGPTVLPLIQKLVKDIEAGKGGNAVTSADIGELIALSNQTSVDIYKRLGITPPPV